MNLTKKLFLGAFMAGLAFTANAQALGTGTVISPENPNQYQTFLQTVEVTYGYRLIKVIDPEVMCLVTINGKSYEVEADIYFDELIGGELGQTPEDSSWGNILIVDFSDVAYETGHPAGEYVIEIPDDYVQDASGNTNAYQEITVTKVDVVKPVSMTPGEGSFPASDLKNFTITFNDNISYISYREPIMVRELNDWLGLATYLGEDEVSIGADGKSLVIDLSTLTRGVSYMVQIPEMFVEVGNLKVNAEIWINEIMNWDGLPQPKIISAPVYESDPNVKPLILTYNYESLSFAPNAPDATLQIGYPQYGMQDGDIISIPADYFELVYVDPATDAVTMNPTGSLEPNALYLDLKDFAEDWIGYDFQLQIPASMVVNKAGLDNPPYYQKFIVVNMLSATNITIDGQVIKVVWPQARHITYALSRDEITLTGEDKDNFILDYNFGVPANGPVGLNESNNGLDINLSNVNMVDGNYLLFIPRGYVFLYLGSDGDTDGMMLCDEVAFEFTYNNGALIPSGIEQLFVNDGKIVVYDLQGRKVQEGSLNGLNHGIYIVNGKKVLVP